MKRATSPVISVIIVTYNGARFIDENLRSLLNQEDPPAFEVVVVDNSSSDDTVARCEEYTELRLKIIRNEENLGFGRACNRGAVHAEGQYLFFTNQDVTFPPRFLVTLLNIHASLARRHGRVILSPAVVFPDETIHYLGGEVHFLGFAISSALGKSFHPAPRVKETMFCSGCGWLMAARDFIALNGFDPHYFMYHEDVDLSLRALRHGIRLFVTRGVHLYHLNDAFLGSRELSLSTMKYYNIERNRFLTLWKNFQDLGRGFLPLVLFEIPLLFQAMLTGRLRERLTIYKSLARLWGKFKAIRRRTKGTLLPKTAFQTRASSLLLGSLRENAGVSKIFNFLNRLIYRML